MKTFNLVLAVIFCVALTAAAQGQADIFFRALIENLCQANRQDPYGSCCDANENGTTVTASTFAPCFGGNAVSGEVVINIDFGYLGLTTIPSGAFVNFTELRTLYLSGNSLTTLVSGTFEGLSSLNLLDFGRNPMTDIEGGAFNGLSELNSLELRNLQITKLVSGTFSGLDNLESLYIYRNSLSAFEGGAFSGLSQVTSLALYDIQLTKLVSGTFDGLSVLTNLNLQSMSIEEIEGGAFNGLSNLNSLSLLNNRLTKIVTGAFAGLENLESLNLAANSIIYLEENIFGANTKVPSTMPIYNNRLLFLPKTFSSGTTSVPTLNVANNCLDCSLYPSPQYSISNCAYNQDTNYCPTSTNNCPSYNKFKLDHCFNCSTKSNDAFCDICMPGYKHTLSGCGCVKCEEGDSCQFGEPRTPDSSCAACTSTIYGDPSTCSSCAAKYKYINGDCAACESNECCPGGGSGSTFISNCSKCTDDQYGCLSCEIGTKYVASIYYSYGTCKPCGENECCLGGNLTETCAECLEDMSGCKTCHAKRRPENGECVWGDYGECWPEGRDPAQKIEHCITCREDDDGCALCEKEYRNQDGVCVEKKKYKSMSIINHANVGVVGIVVFIMSIIGMF